MWVPSLSLPEMWVLTSPVCHAALCHLLDPVTQTEQVSKSQKDRFEATNPDHEPVGEGQTGICQFLPDSYSAPATASVVMEPVYGMRETSPLRLPSFSLRSKNTIIDTISIFQNLACKKKIIYFELFEVYNFITFCNKHTQQVTITLKFPKMSTQPAAITS